MIRDARDENEADVDGGKKRKKKDRGKKKDKKKKGKPDAALSEVGASAFEAEEPETEQEIGRAESDAIDDSVLSADLDSHLDDEAAGAESDVDAAEAAEPQRDENEECADDAGDTGLDGEELEAAERHADEPADDEPADDDLSDEAAIEALSAIGLDAAPETEMRESLVRAFEGAQDREPAEVEGDADAAGASESKDATIAEPKGGEPAAPEDESEIKAIVESILFSVSDPMTIRQLSELVGVGVHDVRSAVEELRYEYVDSKRAFRVEEISGGIQILTRSQYDPWIGRLREKEREGKLSAAALETLAVIAYKQPITKADLEGIRGVGCTPILKTLLERELVEVTGRDEGLGKALLYGTTNRFLESFGLANVKELPQPEDLAAKGER